MAKPEPKRQCQYRTTRGNTRCRREALPRKYFCELHKARFISKDPIKRANQLANLKNRSGVPGNQHLRRTFAVEPTALAEKVEEISGQVLVRDDDAGVPANLRRTVLKAAKIEMELDWLETVPSLTVRQERRREWLEKRLDLYLERLGMSSKAKLEYQPLAEAQARAKRAHPKPNQDPVQMKQRLGLLMRSGQLNQASMEWAASLDPHGTGRNILLNAEELAALSPDTEPDTPPPPGAVAQPEDNEC